MQNIIKNKPFIYIASPYTKGDACINTYCQMKMFNELMNDGIVNPYIPLLSHYLHTFSPRPYIDWINYDLEILHVFDACLRIDANYPKMGYKVTESSGADDEIQNFKDQHKPVFYSKKNLYRWVEKELLDN